MLPQDVVGHFTPGNYTPTKEETECLIRCAVESVIRWYAIQGKKWYGIYPPASEYGEPPTKEDKLKSACHFVEHYGYSVKQAAEVLGLNETDLRNVLKELKRRKEKEN